MLKKVTIRIAKLFAGLFLYAVGIVLTVNASLGLAPWEVFHQGIARTINITMGQASIGAGLIFVIINSFIGEKIGWGTLANMLFIGIFMDILMLNNIIPSYEGFLARLIMLFIGIFVVAVATVFYIGAGLGSGPKDGIMVALNKKTGKSIRLIRNSIEITALILGFLMGGHVGLGTVITSLTVGFIMQFTFKIFNFDVAVVEQRFIDDDIRHIRGLFKKEEDSSASNDS